LESQLKEIKEDNLQMAKLQNETLDEKLSYLTAKLEN
jgi:hypothetical protein